MSATETSHKDHVVAQNAHEATLIRAAVEGEQEAFKQLYCRYYGQVYAFCMRMLQGRADVEDAVQQVFLEAWRSLHRFEGRSLFSTWLIKIAIHTCLSFYRKLGRITLAPDEDSDVCDSAQDVMWSHPAAMPDEQVLSASRRQAIERILGRMSKKKQTVFIMSDMHGMTAPEISHVLGIPDATVRTRLFHARREFEYWVNRNPTYKELLLPHERQQSQEMCA